MRRHLFVLIGIFLALFSSNIIAKEFIIKVQSDTIQQVEQDLKKQYPQSSIKIKDVYNSGKLILVDIIANGQKGDHLKASIENDDRVSYIVPNVIFHTFDVPNDPDFARQWALKKINAPEAWDVQVGSSDVVVAVIDTGIDWKHKDLKDNIWVNKKEIPGNGIDDDNNGFVDDIHGWDFRDNDNNPSDETSQQNPGHGTHCAGIVGAVGNNEIGISGIVQKIALMPIRFLGSDGSGDLMTAAKAIDYAVQNGANVISASWGAAVGRSQVTPILEAVERAKAKGVLFIAAAANDGKNNDTREVYPANAGFSNVISVAASTTDDKKPTWSNFGKARVDLSSPGAGILSTVPGDNYMELNGTSMATPLVAGTAALILSHTQMGAEMPTPEQVKAILQATGAKVEIETACQCRIDANAALIQFHKNELTLVPNAGTLRKGETLQLDTFGGEGPFAFNSSNPQVMTVDEKGLVTAVADGEATLDVKDNTGATATSSKMFVGETKTQNQCPFEGPVCEILCRVVPTFPWCS